MISVAMEL